MSQLTFLGATGTVTGSKYLVVHGPRRVLFDCGLFQGLKELRLRNWASLPIEPAALDAVVLTHAHLDHSGYLPVLVRDGFKGPVLATAPTCDLCGILLPDAGHIQEEDARFANRHGFSRHKPALPLYTEEDARAALAGLRPLAFDVPFPVADGLTIRFRPAGHILGAAHVEVRLRDGGSGAERVLVFSGDVGRPSQPMLPPPTALPDCDQLLLESTYGDREHQELDPLQFLERLVAETYAAGGTLVIPAFAVGRAQTLLYLLHELQLAGRLPPGLPIYVDSPMAIHAIRILMQHRDAQASTMREQVAQGGDPLGLRDVHLISTVDESKRLNLREPPSIIISAAGMATGGRVLHHLARRLDDPRNTVLLVGFQASGTRGRSLRDGATAVKIHGGMVQVRARIEVLDGLSAHADRSELAAWVATARRPPGRVHLVHGEPQASQALAAQLRSAAGLDVHLPQYRQTIEI